LAFSYPDYAIDGADTDYIDVCAIICLRLSRHFPTTLQKWQENSCYQNTFTIVIFSDFLSVVVTQ